MLRRQADTSVAHDKTKCDRIVGRIYDLGSDDDFPDIGELDGVGRQVEQNLPQAQRVAHQRQRRLWSDGKQQLQPLFGGVNGDLIGHVLQHIIQVEGDGFQLQLARFDLGEIENVIDDAQQAVRGREDFAHIVLLFSGQFRLQCQVTEPNDGVHRRANFVAHAGQEITLGASGGLGGFFGGEEFLFQPLPLGDVLMDAVQFDDRAPSVPFDDDAHHHIPHLAAAADNPLVHLSIENGAARGRDFGYVLRHQRDIVGVDKLTDVDLARHKVATFALTGGVVQRVELVVEDKAIACQVKFPCPKLRNLHCHGQLRAATLELYFRLLPIRDVADGLNRAHHLPVGVIQDRRHAPQEQVAPAGRHIGFRNQHIVRALDLGIFLFNFLFRPQDQVNQNWLRPPVKWDGIGILPFTEHHLGRHARQGFDGTVPGNDFPMMINDKGGVRQKVNDVCQPSPGLP